MPGKKKIEQINKTRHSLAHILAASVKIMFPGAVIGMGPAIENGFYHDFDLSKSLRKMDSSILPEIEKTMKEIIKQGAHFKKTTMSKPEAKKLFLKEPYKLELLDDFKSPVTIYKMEGYTDLCCGPHVKSSEEINPEAFKLTKVAGAYWKGDEKKPMLTRIYGIAFSNKKELDEHLNMLAEAEKRDHRLLGQKMELFLFDEEVGAGLPIWLPNGAILRKTIENYLYRELSVAGYQWLSTPHIGNLRLWQKSGHWNFYKENIYSPIKIEDEYYLLKPMNCPFHVKVYNSKIRSYKNLPVCFAELGTVYRYERSGTLHGLTRVRGFTQDDAHIICRPNQIEEELIKLLKQGLDILRTFGFNDFVIYLSTRPEKYAGELKDWKKAEESLKEVMKKLKLKYEIDSGGGVFYGPKIDIKIKDSLKREWQCTTIQFDFNLPERFDMNYIDEKGNKMKPYMIHRALLGSIERFIGVLLEHHAGYLPTWLAPIQAWIIPIGKKHEKYAKAIFEKLKESGLKIELKDDNETLGKKIREGEIQRVPYLLIVGDKEKKAKTISIRNKGKDLGTMSLTEFAKQMLKEL